MQTPVQPEEVKEAMKKLYNGRSCGCDSMPGELLKYAADNLAQPTALLVLKCIYERVDALLAPGQRGFR